MKIKANRKDGYLLLHNGIQALVKAQQVGLRIDVPYIQKTKRQITEEINDLKTEMDSTEIVKDWRKKYGGKFNLNSDNQLRTILYTVRQLEPPKFTEHGLGATDKETLALFNLPGLDKLLRIRKLDKVIDRLDEYYREQTNGIIHPFFNLHTVKTLRSSSSNPNFQNVQKRDEEARRLIRQGIYPSPGNQLMSADYNGIEVRIGCCHHKDTNMIRYIENPDSDLHGDMAKQIFKMKNIDKTIKEQKHLRNAVKNGFVFPQFYGDYYVHNANDIAIKWCELPKGRWKKGQGYKLDYIGDRMHISDWLIAHGIKSYQQFEDHLLTIEEDFWERRFAKYNQWKERYWRQYQKRGYLDMYTGFRCSGLMRRNKVTNTPIQGSAFHCLLWAFVELTKRSIEEKWKTKLVGQIHDEIIFDVVPKERDYVKQVVREVMVNKLREHFPWIIVPIDIDADISPIDGSWYEQKPTEI